MRKFFKSSLILLFMLHFLSSFACNTLRKPSTISAAVAQGDYSREWAVPHGEDAVLYKSLTGLEEAAGVPVSNQTLHSAKAMVICSFRAQPVSCSARARLPGVPSLSRPVDMAKGISSALAAFFATARPDLKDSEIIVSDMVCDHVGLKTPPYKSDSLDCVAVSPRLPEETSMTGIEAESIFAAVVERKQLQGEAQKSMDAVTGRFLCVWPQNSKPQCAMGDEEKDLTSMQVKLPSRPSTVLARRLWAAAADYRALKNVADSKDPDSIRAGFLCKPLKVDIIDARGGGQECLLKLDPTRL